MNVERFATIGAMRDNAFLFQFTVLGDDFPSNNPVRLELCGIVDGATSFHSPLARKPTSTVFVVGGTWKTWSSTTVTPRSQKHLTHAFSAGFVASARSGVGVNAASMAARARRIGLNRVFIIVVWGLVCKRKTRSASRDRAVYYHDEFEKLLEDN